MKNQKLAQSKTEGLIATTMLRKTLKTKSVTDVVAHIKANCRRKNIFTLTCVLCDDGSGYEIGIADINQNGYTATGLKPDFQRYDDASKFVDECNVLLFPNRDKKENMKIQLSTMRMTHSF